MQKKSVSRICAPVKMQINLFVRSLCFVSALLGVDVCGRAMRCSHVVLSALSRSTGEKSEQCWGKRVDHSKMSCSHLFLLGLASFLSDTMQKQDCV